jgi:hypothetical protein
VTCNKLVRTAGPQLPHPHAAKAIPVKKANSTTAEQGKRRNNLKNRTREGCCPERRSS